MAQLTRFEMDLLKALYQAEAGKKTPEGVCEMLQKKDSSVSLKQVKNAFSSLLERGYIYQKYDTTPFADREIGTER